MPADSKGTTTLESKTNFIAGAPVGSTVIGHTTLIHRGKRTQVLQTRVATEGEKLIALIVQTQDKSLSGDRARFVPTTGLLALSCNECQ